MNIKENILELVGNTPLVKINKMNDSNSDVVVKVEYFNPANSVKDRPAKYMIEMAEKKGLINKDTVIIEPTSGNTGIGLAAIAAAWGIKIIIIMPDTMSKERQLMMKAYGADLVLTDGSLGMQGAVDKANELNREIKNSIIAGQFENPANPMAHYLTTGKEIYEDTNGKLDFFVAGIGTGGTISGVGKYLKEKNKSIQIIGVEPASSPLITNGVSGKHGIQGIGANFIPENYHEEYVDKVLTVNDEDAYEFGRMLAQKEGILSGISSGAALKAAITIAQENVEKNIVVLLPDSGSRYLSTKMFED